MFLAHYLKIQMKKEIILFLTCLTFILMSGCASYQYITLNSDLKQDESKEFIIDNDTVNIKYKFSGEDLRVSVTIYNKLQQPLYIDLGRSTVILNNKQINDAFYLEEQVNFIAPLAYVTFKSNQLKDELVSLKKIGSQSNATYFDVETTPLFYRVSLALTPYEDYSSPTFYDYTFWASDIYKSYQGPASRSFQPSNQVYIKSTTNTGFFLELTGLIVLLIIAGLAGNGG